MSDGYWFYDTPAPVCRKDDRALFDAAIDALHGDVAAAAAIITNDAHVRSLYQIKVTEAARALERQALSGEITWDAASRKANLLRNDIMELMRGRTSPVGTALAEFMKKEGLTRETLIPKYAARLFKEGKISGTVFSELSKVDQDKVYAEIVKAAGRSSPKVNAALLKWRHVGRGLIVISIGVSVYNIATAEDPGAQAVEEAAVTGAGIAGGVAGGAAAGLVCGPGAPVCVTVGALVGGALAAFGVSLAF